MTVTHPIIDFGLFDPAIAFDSTPSASSIQTFSHIEDLELPGSQQLYASYEPDFWVLDGNYKFLPTSFTDVHVGWISLAQSNGAGAFAVAPVLTVDFTEDQDVDGLTLRFSAATGDWADDIRVQFYNAALALIQDNTYTPTGPDFYTAQAVTAFRRIVITFNATNKPSRYLRLQSINYGRILQFTAEDIKSCVVVEQIDPTQLTLPIGTMELHLFSNESTFNIVDPTGDYFDLQNRQPLDVYEQVGGNVLYIGRFFLDDWTNPTDNEIIFKCVDYVGLLETIPSLGGFWSPAGSQTYADILTEILEPTGIPYRLTGGAFGSGSGWAKPGSTREVLNHIVFTSGYHVVICARRAVLDIVFRQSITLGSSYSHHLTAAQKGANQSLTLKPLITGVEINYDRWNLAGAATELFNETVSTGDTGLYFDDPVDITTLTISGGTFVSTHPNYVVFNRVGSGNITITGKIWYKRTSVRSDYWTVGDNVKPNIIKIDKAFGIGSTIKIEDFANARYLQKMRLFAPTLQVGDRVLVDTLRGAQVRIMIEKMTLDLAGGFVADVEGSGVVV